MLNEGPPSQPRLHLVHLRISWFQIKPYSQILGLGLERIFWRDMIPPKTRGRARKAPRSGPDFGPVLHRHCTSVVSYALGHSGPGPGSQ